MTRCGTGIGRSVVAAAAAWWFVSGGPSLAGQDIWDTAANGVWQTGSNWLDNTAPGGGDTANFGLAGAYTVTFNGTPSAIQALTVANAANVVFTSIGSFAGEIGTLNVTSASGSRDVIVGNGASLSLGTSGSFVTPSKPLHLTIGDNLSVNSGSTLNVRFNSDVVVPELDLSGQVNVTGAGSTLNADSPIVHGGALSVTAGGFVQTGDASIDGVGSATISGAGSQWIAASTFVGDEGEGTLSIFAGGKVQSLRGIVGNFDSAVGTVTVSGTDSQWNHSTNLIVGGSGSGTLNVTGGGSVSSIDGFLASPDVDSVGTATVTGGAWTMTGRLSVGAEPNSGMFGGSGTLNIQPAGTVSAAQGVVLFSNGLVRLQGGTLDASAISFHGTQGSRFQWTSGTLHVGTFNGNLVNPNGGTLAPGHSAGSTNINGNYTQQAGAALEIEIGGPLAVSGFDFVNVTGSALIDADLDLMLTGGFVPTPSQTFAILIAGSLSGAFDNAASGQRVTTTDGGGSFLVHYGPGSPFNQNQIVLSAFLPAGPLYGDYNQNGTVDAADYVVWRENIGAATLNNRDPNAEGPVGQADYNFWRSRFGQPSGTGATAGLPGSTLPEPATWLLAALCCGAVALCRKR